MSLFQVYHNNVLEFYIVTTDENECNWMMFVRKARSDCRTKVTFSSGGCKSLIEFLVLQHLRTHEEQNLVAYPANGKLFFCTTTEIHPDQELLFYYSRDYCRLLGEMQPQHLFITNDLK